MIDRIDREILADLYLSRAAMDFLTELVEGYGPRFGGSEQERRAAAFIEERFREAGADDAWCEEFECVGWERKVTELRATAPREESFECIALPNCPPGKVEAPLVYLGDGHPQAYEENMDRMDGAVVMVTTATPKFYHRSMHRGEKLGRALEAGAVGFIWMRGEPGGLPETGSARFGQACEVPAISVSYETGHAILRLACRGDIRLEITSTNRVYDTTSYNVIAELRGTTRPEEVLVVGGHYDGHDISQGAADNGAGTAVVLETLRALAPHREHLQRTIRFVGFAQEEMGLLGSDNYAATHADENTVFMLNLDGAGRGDRVSFVLQGWPEGVRFFKDMTREMYEADMSVGSSFGLYSDMYPFSARGVPSATLRSGQRGSQGAPRGYGHTYWDSLDKVNPRFLQMDAARTARILLRLAVMEDIPLEKKSPGEIRDIIDEMGYDKVLRYEKRDVPG